MIINKNLLQVGQCPGFISQFAKANKKNMTPVKIVKTAMLNILLFILFELNSK